MRDHSKASAGFWTGETGRALRGDPAAQVMAFYLFTCPASNMIGMYYLPMPQICHETGLSKQGASKALRRVAQVGFAAYDIKTEHVFVFEMARWQLGEKLKSKDNRRKGVLRLLSGLTKCPFYNDFLKKYGASFGLHLEPISEGTMEPLGSPLEGTTSPSLSLNSSSSLLFSEEEERKTSEVEEGKGRASGDAKKIPPTLEQVRAFCAERNISIDAEKFMLHFGRQGWKLSNGNPMKDWHFAVQYWARQDRDRISSRSGPGQTHPEDIRRVAGQL